ncbi:hypothetical protein [Psychrobacter sp. DAB_AL32B]|uniref:hypothetical protein n=1 Tax=Psychrobacter sp. DAB_AL32B TaxID=1028414 RepID=UPI000F514704|nr:hypothetical protein [Psychrobacter sp. DAB_AL32B]
MYSFTVIFVVYLLLVWMYFRDNTLQLTSYQLLIWFIIIPLFLFGLILMIRWYGKKLEIKETKNPLDTTKEIDIILPDSYQLFINSSMSLPEGNSWSEIIDNHDDLTHLSESLSDFDGLPLLIKPIDRIITAQTPLYHHEDNSDFDNYDDDSYDDEADGFTNLSVTEYAQEQTQSADDLTLRLCALIDEQLLLSDSFLLILAQNFERIEQQNDEPNSAIHIHPDWQAHYIAGINDSDDGDDGDDGDGDGDAKESPAADLPAHTLSKLPIYLCVPSLADSDFLIKFLKQQLAGYGITESVFTITLIIADDESYQPIEFINEYLITIANATDPQACLLIAIDSQINEAWLESSLYTNIADSTVPTEAGILLLFSNKAAQELLKLDNDTSFLLTKITNDYPHQIDAATNNLSTPTQSSTRKHYANHLKTIQHLLLNGSSTPTSKDERKIKIATKQQIESANAKPSIEAILPDSNIAALSDINPLSQPYDMSKFMTFIDSFIKKDLLVNDYYLGHYMPNNSWLTLFISLTLFIDKANNSKQELEKVFLVTKHKHDCILWLTDLSNAP